MMHELQQQFHDIWILQKFVVVSNQNLDTSWDYLSMQLLYMRVQGWILIPCLQIKWLFQQEYGVEQ